MDTLTTDEAQRIAANIAKLPEQLPAMSAIGGKADMTRTYADVCF